MTSRHVCACPRMPLKLAASLYGDAIREHNDRPISRELMKRLAEQSIAAACLFWEEWDIAVLTPDILLTEAETQIQGLE